MLTGADEQNEKRMPSHCRRMLESWALLWKRRTYCYLWVSLLRIYLRRRGLPWFERSLRSGQVENQITVAERVHRCMMIQEIALTKRKRLSRVACAMFVISPVDRLSNPTTSCPKSRSLSAR